MKCPHCQKEFEHPGWSLEEVRAMAAHPTVGLRAADADAFWAHYAAVDFVDAAGRKIVNLRAALLKWKTAQPSHGRPFGGRGSTRAVRVEREDGLQATENVRVF